MSINRLYLAGPMRGLEHNNHQAFDAAASMLRHAGYIIYNPAEYDQNWMWDNGGLPDYRTAFSVGMRWLTEKADGVAVLTRWEASPGASAEVSVARALGLPVNFVATWINDKKQEAA